MNAASKSLASFNVVRLRDALLCADCEFITDTTDSQCLVCGGHALLNLSKVLGGTLLIDVPAGLLPQAQGGSLPMQSKAKAARLNTGAWQQSR